MFRNPPPTISGLGPAVQSAANRGVNGGKSFTRNALQGLEGIGSQFEPNYGTQMPTSFDASSDIFGGALKQRSMDTINEYNANQAVEDQGNPFADAIHRNQGAQIAINEYNPQGFGPWLQALNESAPGGIRPAKGRGDPFPGLPNSPINALSKVRL